MVPAEAAAVAVASSPRELKPIFLSFSFYFYFPEDIKTSMVYIPSGWAIFCIADGAIMIGIEILKPRTVVVMSILVTSTNTRGRNLFKF
jgi:hypothetical protein